MSKYLKTGYKNTALYKHKKQVMDVFRLSQVKSTFLDVPDIIKLINHITVFKKKRKRNIYKYKNLQLSELNSNKNFNKKLNIPILRYNSNNNT